MTSDSVAVPIDSPDDDAPAAGSRFGPAAAWQPTTSGPKSLQRAESGINPFRRIGSFAPAANPGLTSKKSGKSDYAPTAALDGIGEPVSTDTGGALRSGHREPLASYPSMAALASSPLQVTRRK